MDRKQHRETGHGRDKSCNVPSSKEIPGNGPKLLVTQARNSDHDDHASDGMAFASISPTRADAIDVENPVVRHQSQTRRADTFNDEFARKSTTGHAAHVERLPIHAHSALISDLVSDEGGSSSHVKLWDTRVDNHKLARKSTTSTGDIPEDTRPSRVSSLAEDDTPAVSIEELKEIMLGRGWCFHQIEYLAKIYQLPVLFRLARLDRKAQRPEDHRPCLKEKVCIAYNSPQTETYETKHAANCPGTNCNMIKVPYEDLVRIIRSGGVPLVSIHEHPDDGLVVSVHRRKFRGDYITISHVWADGLGNPSDNALPRCQIKLLQSLFNHEKDVGWSGGWVKRLDSMLFGGKSLPMLWMDTLCIPPKDTSLRAQCIDAMASIYAGSSRTFVLDKELMAIPMNQNFDELHTIEKIICSVWMSRSWTLQEAILPEDCLFQLDGAVFQPSPHRIDYRTGEDPICRTLFDDILPVEERDQTRAESFVSIWNNLAGRSTTQAADLYIVLASCLDFKLRQFRKFETFEEKMQRMIFSFEEVPFSLFFNAGPRLRSASNHYNRWVPTQISRHLLTAGLSKFIFPSPRISQYSDHGMRLEVELGHELSIYVVDEVISTPSAFNFHTSDGQYMIQPLIDAADAFQTSAYSATLFFVAKSSLGASSMRSGACFYRFASQTSENLHHEESVVEMAYFCPVLFKVLNTSSDQRDHCGRASFAAREVPCTRKFCVRFDPLPGFRPLKRQDRKKQFASFGMKTALTIFLLNEVLLIFVARPFMNLIGLGPVDMEILSHVGLDDPKNLIGFCDRDDLIEICEPGDLIDFGRPGDLIDSCDPEDLIDFCAPEFLFGWTYDPGYLARRVVFILIHLCIGVLTLSLPWFFGAFIIVRLRDYIVLYQSYDDNSMVDKVARLVNAVGRAILDGLRGICLLPFYVSGLIKPDKVISNDSVEIE